MEVISYNAFGEGDYEHIDYITIDGFALDPSLVKDLAFMKDRISLTVKVKHGINTFLSLLQKLCSEGQILTARVSNYHGGYLLASGVVTFRDEPCYSLLDTMYLVFDAKDVRMDTYSEFDETIYMREVKQKD